MLCLWILWRNALFWIIDIHPRYDIENSFIYGISSSSFSFSFNVLIQIFTLLFTSILGWHQKKKQISFISSQCYQSFRSDTKLPIIHHLKICSRRTQHQLISLWHLSKSLIRLTDLLWNLELKHFFRSRNKDEHFQSQESVVWIDTKRLQWEFLWGPTFQQLLMIFWPTKNVHSKMSPRTATKPFQTCSRCRFCHESVLKVFHSCNKFLWKIDMN